MLDVKFRCGVIPKFFSQEQVADLVATFRRFPTVEYEGAGNAIYGVDQRHLAYLWFRRRCFKAIQAEFGDHLQLIFGMLLDCQEPFGIHHDLKPLPDARGQHSLSFMIPYSVDNKPELCAQAATCIFNQTLQDWQHMPQLDINAVDRAADLAHVPREHLERVSVQQWVDWHCGDLIWWDSALAHVSNDFRVRGHTSKQGIVVHTYVV